MTLYFMEVTVAYIDMLLNSNQRPLQLNIPLADLKNTWGYSQAI